LRLLLLCGFHPFDELFRVPFPFFHQHPPYVCFAVVSQLFGDIWKFAHLLAGKVLPDALFPTLLSCFPRFCGPFDFLRGFLFLGLLFVPTCPPPSGFWCESVCPPPTLEAVGVLSGCLFDLFHVPEGPHPPLTFLFVVTPHGQVSRWHFPFSTPVSLF